MLDLRSHFNTIKKFKTAQESAFAFSTKTYPLVVYVLTIPVCATDAKNGKLVDLNNMYSNKTITSVSISLQM